MTSPAQALPSRRLPFLLDLEPVEWLALEQVGPPEEGASVEVAWARFCQWCRLVRVYDKRLKRLVVFRPRPEQETLFRALWTHRDVLVLKPRQIGISTLMAVWMLWWWYHAMGPEPFILAAHRDATAEKWVKKGPNSLWNLHRRLPPKLRRPLAVENNHELTFADTRASVTGYTEGGKGGTRSEGASGAWLTEYAYYDDQAEFYASVEAIVAEGWCCIETTVRAPGDQYHRMVLEAESGDGAWHLVPFYWWQHRAYRNGQLPRDWARTEEEEALARRWGLDDLQLAWRRQKRAKLGPLFEHEYPATIDDAFRVVDGVYLAPELLDDIETVRMLGAELVIEPSQTGDVYALGLDVGGGVGQDYTSLTVVSAITGQVVYAWSSNRTPPHQAAEHAFHVWKRYPGVLLAESNNHGHLVVYRLRELGVPDATRSNPVGLWTDAVGKDWVTTKPSKLLAYDHLQARLQEGLVTRLPSITLLELRSLVCPKVTPEAPTGQHDDHAMSFALALQALKKIPAEAIEGAHRAQAQDRLVAILAGRTRRKAIPWRC
jgi:hypothetical protein